VSRPEGSELSDRELSERELRDLYDFVESGYRGVRRQGPARRFVGRIARAAGLRPRPNGAAEQPVITEYDSPLDAVYARNPGVFTIPVAWFRNHILFGHGPGAFNAWEATARQLAADPGIGHRDTVLARFYQTFRPATFAELSFANPERDVPRTSRLWQVKTSEYKDVYPWSSDLERWPNHVPPHLRLTEYGPVGDEIVQLEVWRLRRLVASISRDGYRPLETSGTRGYFLKAGPKACFIVKSGFHRAVTLAALGYTDLPVLLSTTAPRLLTLDSLEHWPMVKNGLFEPALAEAVVHHILSDGGAAVAKRLGFEPHP
jgi:hypothetical protein